MAAEARDVDPIDEQLVDKLLTDEELALRDRLRQVLVAEVAPLAASVDRTGDFAERSFRAVAPYCGLMFPREYGGHGASTVAYTTATEEIARACPATSLIWVTQAHAAYPILVSGSAEQRRRYLPPLCSGEMFGSLAITEPSAGSDVSAIRTRARRDGDSYVIDGSKTFITTGDRASIFVCFATVDPQRGRDGITAFLVPGDSSGLERGRVLHKLGMNGSSTAEIYFDGVRIPRTARLGAEGGAWRLSMSTVVKSRLSAAAQGLGVAAAVYEIGLRWAHRKQLLRGAAHQAIQFRLADLRTRIQAARLQLHTVARACDSEGRDLTSDVAMAKITCTDLGFDAANQIVDLLGPEGDLTEMAAERLLRDVKVTQIYDGTNEIQHLLVARDTVAKVEAAT